VAITANDPELASGYPLAEVLQPDRSSLTYTAWEDWLALWHGKTLSIAPPDGSVGPSTKPFNPSGVLTPQQRPALQTTNRHNGRPRRGACCG
jgi:hypothetical protein